MLVAAVVAVVSEAVVLVNDIGPYDNSRDFANARIITASAVSRAGAIEIPSEPRSGLNS
jgi:hypothetical protein